MKKFNARNKGFLKVSAVILAIAMSLAVMPLAASAATTITLSPTGTCTFGIGGVTVTIKNTGSTATGALTLIADGPMMGASPCHYLWYTINGATLYTEISRYTMTLPSIPAGNSYTFSVNLAPGFTSQTTAQGTIQVSGSGIPVQTLIMTFKR
ncbi:MAG: hypothetical protein FWC55_03650 [Firmicutes bacterium]|nr:hypothetical protein [Bacillota bacterium]